MNQIHLLSEYQQLLFKDGLLTETVFNGMETAPVVLLTYNSKEVVPGTLFICKGLNFKEQYLQEALEKAPSPM